MAISNTLYGLREFDRVRMKKYGGRVIGVDEVGMGALAGPVVAVACILRDFDLEGVNDSKKLSPAKLLTAYDLILQHVEQYQIGYVTNSDVDGNGIESAGRMAREDACCSMVGLSGADVIVVDGNRGISYVDPKNTYDHIPCEAIPKADGKSLTVAAASILAKVTRDRMMVDLSKAYPKYDWAQNKGYGTPNHMAGLQAHGLTPYHRKSFAPGKRAEKYIDKPSRATKSLRVRPRRTNARETAET